MEALLVDATHVRTRPPRAVPTFPEAGALEAAVEEVCGPRRAIQTPGGGTLAEGWLVGAYRRSEGAPPDLADFDGGGFSDEVTIWCVTGTRWIGILKTRRPGENERTSVLYRGSLAELLEALLFLAAPELSGLDVVQNAAMVGASRLPGYEAHIEWCLDYYHPPSAA